MPANPELHRELLIYNRHAVADVFEKHRDVFCAHLGIETTASQVLESLDTSTDMNSLVGGNIELQGILLGYGVGSAKAYARLQEICKLLGLRDSSDITRFEGMCLASPGLCEDLKNEFRQLTLNLRFSNYTTEANNAVSFRFLPHDREALELIRGYRAKPRSIR